MYSLPIYFENTVKEATNKITFYYDNLNEAHFSILDIWNSITTSNK